jgi:Fic family protein
VKERYQDLEEKNEQLREYLQTHRKAKEFLERFEMSWVFHDNALEGVVYTPQELAAAITPGSAPIEASMQPAILEIQNHRAAVDYARQEAKTAGRKPLTVSMQAVRHMHDLFLGNTPEAQAARAATERRERTEKELAKERERAGFRKDMPLHRTYFHDIAQPGKIQGLLEKLVESTQAADFKESHPIKQAATFQHQFLQIFPFSDHSGKVARMFSNMYLMRAQFLPAVIHSVDRQRYYESLRGNVNNFRMLLTDAIENSLDNAIKFFQDQARLYRVTP